MKPGGIKPTVEGPYYAHPCNCGHKTCKHWHINDVAEMHGVSFTKEQAVAVADFLNTFLLTQEENELARIAVQCEGMEVPKEMWPAAERLCKKDPDYTLGGARGPGRHFRRLHFHGEDK